MPLVLVDECCSCASGGYPCRGNLCPLRNVPHLLCDDCGEETTLYYYEDEMLCLDCIKDRLHEVDIREVDIDGYY